MTDVTLREHCEQVRERLGELTRYTASAGLQKSRQYSKQHPLRVLAGVLGTAFLAGSILRRAKRNRG